ncbi:MAG: FHA domain-containing protein [Acidobacteria bacterium]|nr:FHA domain-containing protein [Acidobacteriota bacterium]
MLDPASGPQGNRTLLPPSVGIYLQVTEGEDAGRRFDLSRGGAFTIGRRGSDIELVDPKVSRKHAEIQVLARDQYFLVDHGSRNGTRVNGVRLNRRRLRHNDVIRVGDTALQIMVVESGIRPDGSAA